MRSAYWRMVQPQRQKSFETRQSISKSNITYTHVNLRSRTSCNVWFGSVGIWKDDVRVLSTLQAVKRSLQAAERSGAQLHGGHPLLSQKSPLAASCRICSSLPLQVTMSSGDHVISMLQLHIFTLVGTSLLGPIFKDFYSKYSLDRESIASQCMDIQMDIHKSIDHWRLVSMKTYISIHEYPKKHG